MNPVGRIPIREIEIALAENLHRLDRLAIAVPRIPEWFRRLGTDAGIRDFQAAEAVRLPRDLVDYYACQWIPCFLYAYWDVDVFLEELDGQLPPVLQWRSRRLLVVGHFPDSDCVCAVELESDEALIYWEPFNGPVPCEPLVFREWVAGAVQRQLGR